MVIHGRINDNKINLDLKVYLEDLEGWGKSALAVREQFEYCARCDDHTLRIRGECTRCAKKDHEASGDYK